MTEEATSGAKGARRRLGGVHNGQGQSARRPRDDTALIVGLVALARRLAAGIVDADAADDIAQDIAVELFCHTDEGGRLRASAALHALMCRRVRSRCIDWLRQCQRRRRREATHAAERRSYHPTWMSPDQLFEERELAQLYERLIGELAPMRRRTYVMIREEHLSYGQVARALGLPRSAVHGHLVVAQALMRDRLRLLGIVGTERRDRLKTGKRSTDRSDPFPTRQAA